MDEGRLRLVVGLVGMALLAATWGGLMWAQHRAVERAFQSAVEEPVLIPSAVPRGQPKAPSTRPPGRQSGRSDQRRESTHDSIERVRIRRRLEERLSSAVGPAKVALLEQLLKFDSDLGKALLANQEHGAAERAYGSAQRAAQDLWQARAKVSGQGQWESLPISVRERVEDENPGAGLERRLQAVGALIASGDFLPPEAQAIEELLPDLHARWALASLDSRREEGLKRLRQVLHRTRSESIRTHARDSLRETIRRAFDATDFSAVLDLCAFYVADLVPAQGAKVDPFFTELKSSLEKAGEHFSASAPMKRIFVKSLLADLFGADPEGAAARQEVLDRGFSLIESLPTSEMSRATMLAPSGLPGRGIHRIDNATESHLMIFYKGPETFFARVNPMRRGSLVLKDGTYAVAVVVTQDAVRPFRGQLVFRTDAMHSRYYIEHSGGRSPDVGWFQAPNGAPTQGEYTLLRVPTGTDSAVARKCVGEVPEEPSKEGDRTSIDSLIRALAAPSPEATQALRKLTLHRQDRRAFGAVVAAARSTNDLGLACQAVELLPVFRRTFDVASVLTQIVEDHASPALVGQALRSAACGGLPDPGLVYRRAIGHRDPAVRKQAVKLLSEPKGPLTTGQVEPLLQAVHQGDPDGPLRLLAVRGLALRGSALGVDPLATMLASSVPKERSSAASLLGHQYRGHPRAEALLLARLKVESETRVEGDLLRILAGLGSRGLVAILKGMLEGTDKRRKSSALFHTYYWTGPPEAFESMLVDLVKAGGDMADRATERLTQWKRDSSLAPLRLMLADTANEGRRRKALHWLEDWAGDPRLKGLLEPHKADARIGTAVKGLLGGPR